MEFQITNKRLFIDGKNFDLENLEFIEEIGFGANAKVFTAKNKVTDRIEAVKIWKPRNLENYVTPDKFNEEIKKNAKFNRVLGIANIYNGGVKSSIYYAVMEYINGKDLESYLDNNTNFIKRYFILNKILITIETVLKMGFFHGDLHKKNIIITKDIDGNDQPILIDFGTSHFSGKEKSEQRDAKMLYKLCFEVLPEFQKFEFIEKSIIDQGSFVICEFFQYLLDPLNKYINNEKWDIYAQREYCFSLSILKWEFDCLDIGLIENHLINNSFDKKYFDSLMSIGIES